MVMGGRYSGCTASASGRLQDSGRCGTENTAGKLPLGGKRGWNQQPRNRVTLPVDTECIRRAEAKPRTQLTYRQMVATRRTQLLVSRHTHMEVTTMPECQVCEGKHWYTEAECEERTENNA